MRGEKHIIGISLRKNRTKGKKMESPSIANSTKSSDATGGKEVPQNRADNT